MWILGADAWLKFLPGMIGTLYLVLADWLVLERPGYTSGFPENCPVWCRHGRASQTIHDQKWSTQGGSVYTVQIRPHPASSTAIREAWQIGQLHQVRAWLP